MISIAWVIVVGLVCLIVGLLLCIKAGYDYCYDELTKWAKKEATKNGLDFEIKERKSGFQQRVEAMKKKQGI